MVLVSPEVRCKQTSVFPDSFGCIPQGMKGATIYKLCEVDPFASLSEPWSLRKETFASLPRSGVLNLPNR